MSRTIYNVPLKCFKKDLKQSHYIDYATVL